MICNQSKCNDTATHKVYWPGSSPVHTCEAHANMAQGIANGLGITISIEVTYEPTREGQSNSKDSKGEVY